MTSAKCNTGTSTVQIKAKEQTLAISKKISKLILKEILRKKKERNWIGSFYTKKDYFELPIKYAYSGKLLKFTFLGDEMCGESLYIFPDELQESFMNICISIETIFNCVPKINIRNIDFEIKPKKNSKSEVVIVFSYNLIY